MTGSNSKLSAAPLPGRLARLSDFEDGLLDGLMDLDGIAGILYHVSSSQMLGEEDQRTFSHIYRQLNDTARELRNTVNEMFEAEREKRKS